MKHLIPILFIGLLSPLFAKEDYKVEELPYYKISQAEKESRYRDLAEDFVNAKSAIEASKYISDTSPADIGEFTKAYRQLHKKRTGALSRDLVIFGTNGNQFGNITMNAPLGIKSVCQMVWEREKDTPKIDWRATYAYSDTSWEEFFETKPQIPTVMRVRLTKSDYYNFKYADDKKWLCLKCLHPFLKKELFAYVEIDTPKFITLQELITEKGFVDITASFFYPDEVKDPKQVEISDIKHKSWYRKNYIQ